MAQMLSISHQVVAAQRARYERLLNAATATALTLAQAVLEDASPETLKRYAKDARDLERMAEAAYQDYRKARDQLDKLNHVTTPI